MKSRLKKSKRKPSATCFVGACLTLLTLTGCKENPFGQAANSSPSAVVFDYSRDNLTDDFSSISKSTSSASFEKKMLFVHVTITCMSNAKYPEKNNLTLDANVVRKENDEEIHDVSAVLYKVDNADPQIYHDEFANKSSLNGNVSINFDSLPIIIGNDLPEILKLRLVRNASPLAIQIGDIDDLATYPKIDLDIPIRTSNVSKVLSDCKPR